MSSTAALQTSELGKRYGSAWALRDCTLEIPHGRVTALVGPNGAGKTTLLHLAVGLTEPTTGSLRVLGRSPKADAKTLLPRIGFVAQDHPLYRGFTLQELLHVGAKLNPGWDESIARERLGRLGLDLKRKAGALSGGEQAQVALSLALAKRPEFLLLDEPVASLDPLARRDFLQSLLEAVAEDRITVLLSSHILSDLERVCDHLVLLSRARVQLVGEIEEIVAAHRLLIGPRCEPGSLARVEAIVQESHTERQSTLLVRANGHLYDARWTVSEVDLEEIVLAYLAQPSTTFHAAPTPLEVAS
ncbi:MAG TPA: ABC transporter ATP-binding protein [Gaiellaceae bacterium]|nr:ABC transporter ATP-binding protein [Gaiellaceae bacterium]